MKIYAVGGTVRDELLGRPSGDRDWVVVGATPHDMLEAGYVPVGKDFPVFLHPDSKDEYALARTERKTAPGYHGFRFHADASVTLEQDIQLSTLWPDGDPAAAARSGAARPEYFVAWERDLGTAPSTNFAIRAQRVGELPPTPPVAGSKPAAGASLSAAGGSSRASRGRRRAASRSSPPDR